MVARAEPVVRIVFVTAPEGETATRLAHGLVEAGLAACVNVVSGVRSVYRWEGRILEEGEHLLVIKTTDGRVAELERWVDAHHPYDVPEVIVVPVIGGAEAYLSWVESSVESEE